MSCKYKMILKLARISDGRWGVPSLPSMQSWAGTSTKSLNKYLPRTGQPVLFACAGGRAHRRGYIGLPTEIFGRLSASVNLIHNNDGAAYLLPFVFLFHFLPKRCFSFFAVIADDSLDAQLSGILFIFKTNKLPKLAGSRSINTDQRYFLMVKHRYSCIYYCKSSVCVEYTMSYPFYIWKITR